MGISGQSHAWRAIIVACGLAGLAPASNLEAATLLTPGPAAQVRKSSEPFGLFAGILTYGSLRDKWLGVERKLDDERVQLALCDGDRERCASPAALQFLAIVDNARARDGRARIGEINRAINLAIRPMSDQSQYNQADVWSSPLDTFVHGAGDCEDYAIAKFVALQLAGVMTDDLRIVLVHDNVNGEDHAVAAARLDGHWLTLDNRRMAMVDDENARNYRPLFVLDQRGVMKYMETPVQASLSGEAAPLVALNATTLPATTGSASSD